MLPSIFAMSTQSASDVVRELVQINTDSYNGFTQASQQLEHLDLRVFFAKLAHSRIEQARELQEFCDGYPGETLTQENVDSEIHRAILDWRRAFGTSDLAILDQALRGEKYLQAKYAATLSLPLDRTLAYVINRQYQQVLNAYDDLERLRQQLANRNEA